MNTNKIYCCVCGRQIISTIGYDNDYCVSCPNPILMGINTYCCHICGKDLDENGLFPEEIGYRGYNND